MLVLASASPRRQELLRNAGIPFVVQSSNVAELPKERENPRACAERLARGKALAVFRQRPNDFILGADTIVIVDGQILGKPHDEADASRMLRLLSGRMHEVITGVCLVGPRGVKPSSLSDCSGTAEAVPSRGSAPCGQAEAVTQVQPGMLETMPSGFEDTRSEVTLVTMSELSGEEIRSYIASGEPMDKAGAYAIQRTASRWISRIEGDYFNVVGLPVALVHRMLTEHGCMYQM
jgi:septum formation protein